MPLSDSVNRAAKPGTRDRTLTDEKGLYPLFGPTGSKLWRLRYRHGGQEKKPVIGSYPEIGLKEARLGIAIRDPGNPAPASRLQP